MQNSHSTTKWICYAVWPKQYSYLRPIFKQVSIIKHFIGQTPPSNSHGPHIYTCGTSVNVNGYEHDEIHCLKDGGVASNTRTATFEVTARRTRLMMTVRQKTHLHPGLEEDDHNETRDPFSSRPRGRRSQWNKRPICITASRKTITIRERPLCIPASRKTITMRQKTHLHPGLEEDDHN